MSVNTAVVSFRHLVNVCLQQNIASDIDVLVNSVTKIVIGHMLHGIPTKRNKVFWFCFAFIV